MKISRVEPSEYCPKRYTLLLNFDPSTGILSGTAGTDAHVEEDLILDVNIDLNKWVGKLVEARIEMTDQGYELLVFDALKNYSLNNGMPATKETRLSVRYRLFRIFVHENIDDSIIQIFWGHEAIEGFEDIVEENEVDLRLRNLVQADSGVAKLMKLHRLKSAMLGEVDQRDSVSYLEAQVDILTRLVLELHKDDTSPLVNILRQADEQSVLAIKGADALSQEFLKKKAWVRTVQKDYYEAKKALEATPTKARYEVQP